MADYPFKADSMEREWRFTLTDPIWSVTRARFGCASPQTARGGGHPLSAMPEILARAKQHKVVCTAGYCLKPKKSVVFEMELAPAEACGETAHGDRICAHCSRRDTCPNRR